MKKFSFKSFMKEWGLFLFFMGLFLLSRFLFWSPVRVDGHSMDPTLANGEYLLELRHLPIDRFDVVVAKEKDEAGKDKRIVKRVIGMPGDQIRYDNDQLYINGKKTDEPYLADYLKKFKEDKLQSTYSYNQFFKDLAQQANAFTQNAEGQASFTIEVPEGEYLLLGDDRIVSKDSRQVGTFKKDQIEGETVLRFWPLNKIGTF
ncbi:signal peptidase I [Streptococcus oricebi]|uniref:Signal peptidase I n=1 Tax=Streptococcus oricebi TaxID=1547447 RepID=A0ABS5B4J4_9STRE|nr:signal peptidase I [Streptococcus oricebi]MBP2623729.1 signal peptidase I [Streptococcus oricebi]